jgi:hypothetical protein
MASAPRLPTPWRMLYSYSCTDAAVQHQSVLMGSHRPLSVCSSIAIDCLWDPWTLPKRGLQPLQCGPMPAPTSLLQHTTASAGYSSKVAPPLPAQASFTQ